MDHIPKDVVSTIQRYGEESVFTLAKQMEEKVFSFYGRDEIWRYYGCQFVFEIMDDDEKRRTDTQGRPDRAYLINVRYQPRYPWDVDLVCADDLQMYTHHYYYYDHLNERLKGVGEYLLRQNLTEAECREYLRRLPYHSLELRCFYINMRESYHRHRPDREEAFCEFAGDVKYKGAIFRGERLSAGLFHVPGCVKTMSGDDERNLVFTRI